MRPVFAVMMAGLASAATQASEAALTGRSSVNYFYYFGGFAIDSHEGHDGAPTPAAGPPWTGVEVTSLSPATLAISGAASEPLEYLSWSGYVGETWKQIQTFSFGNGPGGHALLQAEGSASITQDSQICSEITGCGQASELHRSTNTQALEFTLDGPADYLLQGSTTGGQFINIQRWNTAQQQWDYVLYGGLATADQSFSIGGALDPGLFRVTNHLTVFSGGGPTNVVNSWDYDLTLIGAVAAVPEPGAGWLALAGLALVAGARRHRRG